MSESELAAAIWPYEKGSSTMGVKKSTVCTRARCRSRRYTPASSKVLELTSTLRSNEIGSCGKTCRRACWLNLEAHPALEESEVSLRICSRDIVVHLLSELGRRKRPTLNVQRGMSNAQLSELDIESSASSVGR